MRTSITVLALVLLAGAFAGQARAAAPYRDPAYSAALREVLTAKWPNHYSRAEQGLGLDSASTNVRRGLWHARVASRALPDFKALVGFFRWSRSADGITVRLQRDGDVKWFQFGAAGVFGGFAPDSTFEDAQWWSACPLVGNPTPGCELELNGLTRSEWIVEHHQVGLPWNQFGRMRIVDPAGSDQCYLYYEWRCDLGQTREEDALLRYLWTVQGRIPGSLDSIGRCLYGNTGRDFPCYVRALDFAQMEDTVKLQKFEQFSDQQADQVYPRYCTGCSYQMPVLDLDAARAYLDGADAEATAAREWIDGEIAAEGARVPIIFLPGIQGSVLACNGAEVWPEVNHWLEPLDQWLDAVKLQADGLTENECASPLTATDVIRAPVAVDGAHDVYASTIRFLENAGYEEGRTLFVFPFDWRRSPSDNAPALLAKIDEVLAATGKPRVDILAHSQGGLVTRVALTQPRSVGKVRRVLTMGTPVLGAAKLLGVLLAGKPCLQDFAGMCLLHPPSVMAAVRNLPGAYSLLPSAGYFSAVGAPYWVNGVALTYPGYVDVVANDSNGPLARAAAAWHETWDPVKPLDPSVQWTRLVGSHLGTFGSLRRWSGSFCIDCSDGVDYDFSYVDGDGTVPRGSASRPDGIPNVYARDVAHAKLPDDPCLMGFAIAYFELPDPAPTTSECVSATPSPIALHSRAAADAGAFGGYELAADGPLAGYVADGGGRRLGPDPSLGDPSAVALGIPGGDYNAFGQSQSFFLNVSGSYTAQLVATAAGPVRIRLRRYANGALAEAAPFVVAHVAAGETLTLRFGDASVADATIADDRDGDGTADATIAPDSVVTGDAASDTTPPDATADPVTAAGATTATVTLAGDDGASGSGVAALFYTVGGGAQQRYSGPFEVPLFTGIAYRAVDRAGNLGPVRKLIVDDAPSERRLADALALPARLRLTVAPQGDVDWFRFAADGATTYRVTLHDGPQSYEVAVLGADGAAVASGRDLRVHPAAGTYYVRVDGVGGSWDAVRRYDLRVSALHG